MVTSTNQNRHLYVAKAYNATVDDASAVGTIGGVKVIGEGKEKELIFMYRGADNTLKSDSIQLENLGYAKAIKAADLITPLKSQIITLDPNVNGGLPVAGQDYILRINLSHWIGMSEYDQYCKEGAVHAVSGMTAAQFYQKMVDSLNLSFSREIGANKNSNPYFTFSVNNGIVITEKEQPWRLGIEAQEPVIFSAQPTTIFFSGEDAIWGVVADNTPAKSAAVVGVDAVGNGKKMADLEWFCMGERGDQYRMKGYPNYIPTQYLVDPTKEYNVLELHHAYTDKGVNSYRSEKDITIISDDAAALNSLISEINTQAGLNIQTI